MDILRYNELSPRKAKDQFERVVRMLSSDNFRAAEVKKLGGTPYYRAKLDKTDRLLFTIMKHQGANCILLLEIIYNHEYDKSRFLNGAHIDESKIEDIKDVRNIDEKQVSEMIFRNLGSTTFHLLDKVISFDDIQQEVFQLKPPVIIIGSAGSGKTVLTLEKLKQLRGNILYVTRSQFLADNSRKLYFSNAYDNKHQEIDFLSFQDFVAGIRVPEGQELIYRQFFSWFNRHRQNSKLKDAHALFEEFNGVITGMPTDCAYLSKEDYLALGVKQSIFSGQERECAYELFLKHLNFMRENGFYNLNMVAFEYIPQCQTLYDFAVIDEIQDLTNVQLALILKSLKNPHNFVLCGDSNQIVHPNFFSWSKVKTMFYLRHQHEGAQAKEIIKILHSNYRNSQSVTAIANRLLIIKNARFGSIDRESNYLVECNSSRPGTVELLNDRKNINQEIDDKTSGSTKFAVLVMRDEQKADAKRFFKTPLVFSIQEAKGLEYENIILYNFVSCSSSTFDEIIDGVNSADLNEKNMTYSRAKDKSDKSLEMFKFHINSLYVAVTRAISNLYLIENRSNHPLFKLLEIETQNAPLKLDKQNSSKSEWQEEASRLERQGKQEQADAIKRDILKNEKVPWQVLEHDALPELVSNAFDPIAFNKKDKKELFDYVLTYNLSLLQEKLIDHNFKPASRIQEAKTHYHRIYQLKYQPNQAKIFWKDADRYGVDFRNQFNQTPLMISCRTGNAALATELLDKGANPMLSDNTGHMAFHHLWMYLLEKKQTEVGEFARIYRRLEPDSMNVKVNNRLVKLGSHQMEFFHFNFIFATIPIWPSYKATNTLGTPSYSGIFPDMDFESLDIVFGTELLPDFIMPEYRKQRPYISSMLAKNELSRDGDYNHKLFLRIKTGHYLINPDLELDVNGNWINFYDLIHYKYLGDHFTRTFSSLSNTIWIMYLRDKERKEEFSQYEITNCVIVWRNATSKEFSSNPYWSKLKDEQSTFFKTSKAAPLVEKYMLELGYTKPKSLQ